MRKFGTLVPALAVSLAALLPTAGRAATAGPVIQPVAGGGIGDGAPATQTILFGPQALALGPDGSLLVADSTGGVRLIGASAPFIATTLVHPMANFTPSGLAMRSDGRLWYTDTLSNSVGFIGKHGVVQPLAGSWIAPTSIAADGAGNLFVAEPFANRVRRISGRHNVITDLKVPGLNRPMGVAIAPNGGLYIADTGNSRVLLRAADGSLTTVAGNGTLGSAGDGAPATAAQVGDPVAVLADSHGGLYIVENPEARSNAPLVELPPPCASGVCVPLPGSFPRSISGPAPPLSKVRHVDSNGTISTLAGTGSENDPGGPLTDGGAGDGGPGVAATLTGPTGVALDASGDVFVSEDGFGSFGSVRRVRRIDPAGTIHLYAGSGLTFAGDGGPATNAAIAEPHRVAVDSQGDLFFSDFLNFRIREISAAGVIRTVAGTGVPGYNGDGAALSTELHDVEDVTLAPDGSLLFTDSGNNLVRRLTSPGQAGSQIVTVAGNTVGAYAGDSGPAIAASLSYPTEVSVIPGGAGAFLIDDQGNDAVREVQPSGFITTVVGNGSAGFGGDGGPPTSAQLSAPTSVLAAPSGVIYIADDGGLVVRRVAGGIIDRFAGTGYATVDGDGGPASVAALGNVKSLALDANGDLLLANTSTVSSTDRRVRIITKDGDIHTIVGSLDSAAHETTGPGFAPLATVLAWEVTGLALGGDGSLFISESGPDRIIKDPAPLSWADVGGPGATIPSAQPPTPPTAGGLHVPQAVGAIDWVAGGARCDGYPGADAAFSSLDLAIGPSGLLGIADGWKTRLHTLDLSNGLLSDLALSGRGFSPDGTPAQSALSELQLRIAYGPDGWYYSDTVNNVVRHIDPTTSQLRTVAGPPLSQPGAIALDAAGDLFIADTGNRVIRRVDHATGAMTIFAGVVGKAAGSGDGGPATSATLQGASQIAVDAGGNVFFADPGGEVRRVDAVTGIISAVAGSYGGGNPSGDGGPATAAKLGSPSGLALIPGGGLYVSDGDGFTGSNVRRVDANGTISTYAGRQDGAGGYAGDGGPATAALFDGPGALALAADGTLYVADDLNNRVRAISTAGVVRTAAGNGQEFYCGDGRPASGALMQRPQDVNVAPNGGLLVSDTLNGLVREVKPDGNIVTLAGGGPFDRDGVPARQVQLFQPDGAAYDAHGNLYIAESAGQRIRMVDVSGVIHTVAGVEGKAGWSGEQLPAKSATLNWPSGIVIEKNGNVLWANLGQADISELDLASQTVSTWAGNPALAAYGGDGGPRQAALFDLPMHIKSGPDGSVYVADYGNQRVRRIDPSGLVSTVAGNSVGGSCNPLAANVADGGLATSTCIQWPEGVAADAAGNVFISDTGDQRIRMVDPSGVIHTLAGSGDYTKCGPSPDPGPCDLGSGDSGDGGPASAALVKFPQGMAVDSSGHLFFADSGNGRVRAITYEAVPAAGPPAASVSLALLSPTNLSEREGAGLAFDPKTNQLYVTGGDNSVNVVDDTWALQGSLWARLNPAATPTAVTEAGVAYDPDLGAVVEFGGDTHTAPNGLSNLTWMFDGATWSQLHPAHSPPGRRDASLAYDAVDHELVLFGGIGENGFLGDTWTFDGTDWTERTRPGDPGARYGAAAAFDSTSGGVILFGGLGGDTLPADLGDTWLWSANRWIAQSPTLAPSAREMAAMASAPGGGVTLFGGDVDAAGGSRTGTQSDTWIYRSGAWTKSAATGPPARYRSALAYAPALGGDVLVAGCCNGQGDFFTDTWTFGGSVWTERSRTDSPSVRLGAVMTTTPAGAVLFGGEGGEGRESDTWLEAGRKWSELAVQTSPPGRVNAATTYDQAHKQVVMFGGQSFDNSGCSLYAKQLDQNDFCDDTWTFDGSNWNEALAPSPVAPPYRTLAALAFDGDTGQTILFGGYGSTGSIPLVTGSSFPTDLNDTWNWNGTTWSRLSAAASPPALEGAALGWDQAHHQLILFGGEGDGASGPQYFNQTWSWDGSTWHQLSPAHSPPALKAAGFTFDPSLGGMLLVGGQGDGPGVFGQYHDAWLWNGNDWVQLGGTAALPNRYFAPAAYDPVLGATVVFGGGGDDGNLGDTWSLMR